MKGLPCRDVAEAIASDRLEVSPPRRRLAIAMHLLLCGHCRRYARQLRAIGVAARDVFSDPAGDHPRLASLGQTILARLGR